jgi:DNA-binding SARP family transcriptional activator/CheY-like chemotaxis protein
MLKLAFLGVPLISTNKKAIIIPSRKALALLIYLAVEGSLHSREKLTNLFWPDSDEERGRGSLRRALLQLRQSLDAFGDLSQFIIAERGLLGFNLEHPSSLDISQLNNAYNLSRSLDMRAAPAQLKEWVDQLQPAIRQYRGDFLEGFTLEDAAAFDDWASTQRELYQNRSTLVFDRLSQLQYELGDLAGAIETATLWVRYDTLNETAYARLMKLYLDSENYNAARQVYQNCQNMLKTEFGGSPSPATQLLVENLSRNMTTTFSNIAMMEKVESNNKKARILVVDDDVDMLNILNIRLSQSGYEVNTLNRPRDSLSLLNRYHFDLLITDAMMPGFSGFDLTRAVRSTTNLRHLPVLMLTTLHSEEDTLQAFRDGVDAFLTKPWQQNTLDEKIRSLLNPEQAPVKFDQKCVARGGSGLETLDKALGGSWPAGTNTLLVGEWGSGKSTFASHFLIEGLLADEPGLWVNFDDNPARVSHRLDILSGGQLEEYSKLGKFKLLDALEWCIPNTSTESNDWKVLSDLAKNTVDEGRLLGQSLQLRAGGRRVLDSISSLFIQYEFSIVQRFLLQLSRTSQSYGGVSTLFIVEQEAVEERIINQIKYFMDCIIEMRYNGDYQMRILNHRWQSHSPDWFETRYYR